MSTLRVDTLIPYTSGSTVISSTALLNATASYALTASYAMNGGGGGGFPYTGSADITGSLSVIGPTTIDTNPLIFLNSGFLGPKVTFEKTPYSSSQIDVITFGITELARANYNGLYNAAVEGSYGGSSPVNTEWNSIYTDSLNYGWGELQSISSRTYSTWYNAVNQGPGNYILELPMVMHDLITNKYYLFKFHKWTPGGVGGGFAYDRYEIINLPVSTSFTKPDYSTSTQDTISAGVIIARGNNQGLYNSVVEASYDNNAYQSPLYTRWNSIYTDTSNYGWNNLSNVKGRKFDTWKNAVNGNPPDSVSSSLQLVMHDITTDQYHKVMFTQWTQGAAGGGFAYERIPILPEATIIFPDGTSQTTAPTQPSIRIINSTLYSVTPAAGPNLNNNNSIILGYQAGYSSSNANNSNFLGFQAGQLATNAYNSNFLGNGAGSQATNAYSSNFLGAIAGTNATNAYNSNFLGNGAGAAATNANYSNFLGQSAGDTAINAQHSNFLGFYAGYLATYAYNSNFLGFQAGDTAIYAYQSNFLGSRAGRQATSASYSNFLGSDAGREATYANGSNFLGSSAGNQATNASYSNFLGAGAGNQATYAYQSNFLGTGAGFQATNANYSNFLGSSVGVLATYANYSNFLGTYVGYQATSASYSNFLGRESGYQATYANYSNFLGWQSGYQSPSASNSNFLGRQAGYQATNAQHSNFLGYGSGYQATDAYQSTFTGYASGWQAYSASYSNFLGNQAGYQANRAFYSNFLGASAGSQAASASFSILVGYKTGWNVAGGSLGIKSNNIIIGTNLTLPDGAKDSINIGGIIFATGSYNQPFTYPFSGSMFGTGKVGINKITPAYTLDVSGSGNFSNALTVTGSLTISNGSVTMVNRPAFRVTGSVNSPGADKSTGFILSGSFVYVDYNQGGYYNNTNGQFTCPLAGLYHIWYVGRAHATSGSGAVAILKNNSTVLTYWEADLANVGHFGSSTVVNLAVNDVVTAKVTLGNITFDINDNWGAAYIG